MTRSEAWFLAVTMLVVGFIVGEGWAEIVPGQTWLYSYQTLITGGLAVLAALFTVNAMWASDQRQQERHQQILQIGRSAERLKVRRAAYPYAMILEEFAKNTIAETIHIVRNCTSRSNMDDVVKQLNFCSKNAKSLLTDTNISDAHHLFDEAMSYCYLILIRGCDNLNTRRDKLIEFLKADEGGTSLPPLEEIASQLDFLGAEFPDFSEQLLALAKEYE